MLPNYDAKAVADVLGLAFLREPKGDVSGVRPLKKDRSTVSRPAQNDEFVIHVDDATMRIIEIETKNPSDATGTPKTLKHPARDFGGLLSPPSFIFIEKAVEQGLPRTALRHVAEWLAGNDKTRIAAVEWGVVPKTTLDRRDTKLSIPESERTERIARLFVHARRALGTETEAREFMTTPHPELGGRCPIDSAKTDLGTRRTEQLLNALEYGLAL